MSKNIKKMIYIVGIFVFVCIGLDTSVSNATGMCFIKVPVDSKVYINGMLLGDDKAVSSVVETGRIHQIAAAEAGVFYGSKQFILPNEWKADNVTVLDNTGTSITPKLVAAGVVDYTAQDAQFNMMMSSRISECASALHNRIGYGSSVGFANCIASGSDAYNKAVASDAGRKWGKPINPPGIASVELKELYRYNVDMFSAKVTVTSLPVGNYIETYNLYMLFRKKGNNYFVTNFTYQP